MKLSQLAHKVVSAEGKKVCRKEAKTKYNGQESNYRKGLFTNYVTQLGWVGGQQKHY